MAIVESWTFRQEHEDESIPLETPQRHDLLRGQDQAAVQGTTPSVFLSRSGMTKILITGVLSRAAASLAFSIPSWVYT